MVWYRTHPDICVSILLPLKCILALLNVQHPLSLGNFSVCSVISTDYSRQACYVLSPFESEPDPKILPKHTHPKHWVQWRKIEHRNSIGRTRPFAHVHAIAGTRNEEQKSRKFIHFNTLFQKLSNIFELFWNLLLIFLETLHHAVKCTWPKPQEIQHLGSVYRHLGWWVESQGSNLASENIAYQKDYMTYFSKHHLSSALVCSWGGLDLVVSKRNVHFFHP